MSALEPAEEMAERLCRLERASTLSTIAARDEQVRAALLAEAERHNANSPARKALRAFAALLGGAP